MKKFHTFLIFFLSFTILLSSGLAFRKLFRWSITGMAVGVEEGTSDITLYPTADSMVDNREDYRDVNFGGNTKLLVTSSEWDDRDRRSFIRFDLSGLEGEIVSAEFCVYRDSRTPPGWSQLGSMRIERAADDWSEYNITWLNQPDWGFGDACGFVMEVTAIDKWYCQNVTKCILQEYEGDKLVSFALAASREGQDGYRWAQFNSKESGENIPYIRVKYKKTTENFPVKGILSASPLQVLVGETFTVTIEASDEDGMSSLYLYDYKNERWLYHICSGTSCVKEWKFKAEEVGEYAFLGFAYGRYPNGTVEQSYTQPSNITVIVANETCVIKQPSVHYTHERSGEPGSTQIYFLVIKNEDTPACEGSLFSVKPTRYTEELLKEGWEIEIYPKGIPPYLLPGEEWSVVVDVTSPIDATPGEYSITLNVSHDGHPYSLVELVYVVMETAPTCYDSDGGINYYVKGTVSYEGRRGSMIVVENKTDECLGDVLYEYYCENGEVEYETFLCVAGCNDGACLKPPPIELVDSYCGNGEIVITLRNLGERSIEVEIFHDGPECGFTPDYSMLQPGVNQIISSGCEGGAHTFKITGGERDIEIEVLCMPWVKVEHTFEIHEGWNLISLPLDINASFFTDENCTQYAFEMYVYFYKDGRYVSAAEEPFAENGLGLWVYVPGSCTATMWGPAITIDDFAPLEEGWNLIGAPSEPVEFSEVIGNCEVESGPWRYDPVKGEYERTDELKPGEGYWVKVTSDCKLSKPIPMPPPPPEIIIRREGKLIELIDAYCYEGTATLVLRNIGAEDMSASEIICEEVEAECIERCMPVSIGAGKIGYINIGGCSEGLHVWRITGPANVLQPAVYCEARGFYYQEVVEDYYLIDVSKEEKECFSVEEEDDFLRLLNLSDLEGEVCVEGIRLQYENPNTREGVFVIFTSVTEGEDIYAAIVKALPRLYGPEGYIYGLEGYVRVNSFNISRGHEPHELVWRVSPNRYIFIQEYKAVMIGESKSYSYPTATGKNPVIKWFVEHFRPIPW